MVTQLFETIDRRELWSSHNPLGRLSTPEEYRAATVFLASSGSSFMTGYTRLMRYTDTRADLRIDGGHCAW
jgi:NAD(P)-dependent dehydrogenase (short-subunit alcohol dehydrogenase family)